MADTPTQPEAQPTSFIASDTWQRVAIVEIDRFCEACGYNLRTQPVRREPRTQVLMCRCPECGRFQAASDTATAARPWLHRLATLLLLVWMLLIAGTLVAVLFLEGAVAAVTLDILTVYTRVYNTWQVVLRSQVSYYGPTMVMLASCSFGLGFLGTVLATAVVYHWPRWSYYAWALFGPALVAVIVWLGWWENCPHLARWASGYICGHMLAQMLGGLVGVPAGRPLARLVIRMLLPPRPRAALAFLWLVDGKTPPAISIPSRRPSD